MGMSYGDFFRMLPEEFEEAAKAWREMRDSESHERWELMRMEAAIMIQPHVREKITPRRLLPFPWETEEDPAGKDGRDYDGNADDLDYEERQRRAAAALEKWGNE